jgi:selT/selW/selH-like putative selenoprotein
VADEILSDYQHIIDSLDLKTSSGGAFEVRVNDELIFSKKSIQRRHAEPGEVVGLFRDIVGSEVQTYPDSG